jgi:hypothetical protein
MPLIVQQALILLPSDWAFGQNGTLGVLGILRKRSASAFVAVGRTHGSRCYNLLSSGLKLPGAEPGTFLCVAARSLALAITVAATVFLHLQAVGSSQEVSMDTKLVHRKVVRNSVLEVIQGIGTAAIAGVLAT